MGFIEDVFEHGRGQRHARVRDVEQIVAAAQGDAAQSWAHLQTVQGHADRLQRAVDRLQLVCNAFAQVLEQKGLASREELELLIQQIDLLDGVEDGKAGQALREAPRCRTCSHFVNPAREECIYCGSPIARSAAAEGSPYRGGPAAAAAPKQERLVTCSACAARVPQSQTFFTDEGALVCASCRPEG